MVACLLTNMQTWQQELRQGKGIGQVYRLCCREENSSHHLHPDLTLRAAFENERTPGARGDVEEPENDLGLEDENKTSRSEVNDRAGPNVADCRRTTVSSQELRLPANMTLPIEAQIRIVQHLLTFEGEPVHTISRLDPYITPRSGPNNINWQPRLLHRFHVGTASVSLVHAIDPNDLLAPLLVCSQWHFWGSTIFYGENRFVFSSLGE